MSPLTILIAIGEEDRGRIGRIADAIRKIVGDRDAEVILAHVLTESEYEDATDTLAEHVERDSQPVSAARPESGAMNVGVAGGGSVSSDFEREQSELPPEEAAKRIIGQKALVRDMVDALDEVGITCDVRGAIGDPPELVLEMIEEISPDFVVVGGRDRSAARQAVFGSISQEIIRSADCPVISVRIADEE